MAGGGSKPGERRGGRKRGTPNKASAARQAEAAAEGVMPCEVMLANMRFAYGRALELQALLGEIDTPTAKSTEGYTASQCNQTGLLFEAVLSAAAQNRKLPS